MMNLQSLFVKARQSRRGLAKLNTVLAWGIPFNRPHRLKIMHLSEHRAEVAIPFSRRNLNHIKGIHACCLATGAEFTSGLVLLGALDADKYRLIMKNISVDYHYQARRNCMAVYALEDSQLSALNTALQQEGQSDILCEVKVVDAEDNHICTGKILWQIKAWNRVKTAV